MLLLWLNCPCCPPSLSQVYRPPVSKADGAFAGRVADAFALFLQPTPPTRELLDGQMEDTGGHHALDVPGKHAVIGAAAPAAGGAAAWGAGAPLQQQPVRALCVSARRQASQRQRGTPCGFTHRAFPG